MNKVFLVSLLACLFPLRGFSFEVDNVYIQSNGHFERRDSTTKMDVGYQLGLDFQIVGPLYAGPRLGLTRLSVVNQPTSGIENKLSGGLHAYGLLPLGLFSLKGGIAADLIAGDGSDQFYLYTAAEGGIRLSIPLPLYLEVPFEVGVFSISDDKITLYRMGLQAGFEF